MWDKSSKAYTIFFYQLQFFIRLFELVIFVAFCSLLHYERMCVSFELIYSTVYASVLIKVDKGNV